MAWQKVLVWNKLSCMVLTKNDHEIIGRVWDIVYSSGRKMPAHYTSNGDRTQSFCIDFESLTRDDDTDMAGEAWYSIDQYLSNQPEIPKHQSMAVIICGENVMVGAYIITKLGSKRLAESLTDALVANTIKSFPTLKNLDIVFALPYVKDYFTHCIKYGENIADGPIEK